MVAGLEQPTSGRILIGDTDLTGSRPYERPVNTVFQSYALFPHLTVPGQRRVRPEASRPEERGAAGRRGAGPGPVAASGGAEAGPTLRRAAAARRRGARSGQPTRGPPPRRTLGALDLKLRRQMQVELKRIQTEVGLTFIHVTHDQEEAMTMADTVAVMNHGRIEQMARRRRCTTCRKRRSSPTSSASPTSGRAGSSTPTATVSSPRFRVQGEDPEGPVLGPSGEVMFRSAAEKVRVRREQPEGIGDDVRAWCVMCPSSASRPSTSSRCPVERSGRPTSRTSTSSRSTCGPATRCG